MGVTFLASYDTYDARQLPTKQKPLFPGLVSVRAAKFVQDYGQAFC